MKWPLLFLISIYRKIISPLLPASCRFHPTCSAYAQEALQIHGFFKGGGLMIRRICRCHPWNPGGVDPVPPKASNPSTRSLSEKHSD